MRERHQKEKDTKTLIGYLEMPEVDPEVIRAEVCLLITVDAYTVYVIGVRIGEYSPRRCLHHQLHWLYGWHLRNAHSIITSHSPRLSLVPS